MEFLFWCFRCFSLVAADCSENHCAREKTRYSGWWGPHGPCKWQSAEKGWTGKPTNIALFHWKNVFQTREILYCFCRFGKLKQFGPLYTKSGCVFSNLLPCYIDSKRCPGVDKRSLADGLDQRRKETYKQQPFLGPTEKGNVQTTTILETLFKISLTSRY